MLPVSLQMSLSIGLVLYYLIIIWLIKKRSIALQYALLWLLSGIVLAVLIVFPNILVSIVHIMGIESNMNGLFVMAIAVILVILMSITSIVSKQNERVRKLVQQQALMEKRIRELENKLYEKD